MDRQPGPTEGPNPARKRCPDCGEVKPLEAFCRNKRSRDGRAAYCKPCHNARTKESVQRLHGGNRHYRLQVDHHHETNAVRGVLCDGCNGALGAFNEDEALILRAIAYLG